MKRISFYPSHSSSLLFPCRLGGVAAAAQHCVSLRQLPRRPQPGLSGRPPRRARAISLTLSVQWTAQEFLGMTHASFCSGHFVIVLGFFFPFLHDFEGRWDCFGPIQSKIFFCLILKALEQKYLPNNQRNISNKSC